MKKKKGKVLVALTLDEARMLRNTILKKRNELAKRNGPTEDLDEILLKLLK